MFMAFSFGNLLPRFPYICTLKMTRRLDKLLPRVYGFDDVLNRGLKRDAVDVIVVAF